MSMRGILDKILLIKALSILDNIQYDDVNHITFKTNPTDIPTDVGTTYWDAQDRTLTTIMPNGQRLQHGQELCIGALNKTDATIPNGSVVYISGSQGNRATIELASNTSYENSSKVIGMTTIDILKNEWGPVTILGLVRDLNTDAFNEGDCLYLSDTPGQLTTTKPTDGSARIKVGMCDKSHQTDGWVCVHVSEEKYMFGDPDNDNYSFYESNGVHVAKGDAITYRDEYVAGEYFVPDGASAPDKVNVTIGGVTTSKWAFDGSNTSEKLGNNFEINHYTALDAVNNGDKDIEFHIHLAPSTVGSGVCRFTVDWCLIKAQGAPIAGTQLVLTKALSSNTQYHNIIFGDALTVPVGGFDIGDLIEFTITRTPTHQDDTYGSDVIFYKCALHVPIDMNGSRQPYIK